MFVNSKPLRKNVNKSKSIIFFLENSQQSPLNILKILGTHVNKNSKCGFAKKYSFYVNIILTDHLKMFYYLKATEALRSQN